MHWFRDRKTERKMGRVCVCVCLYVRARVCVYVCVNDNDLKVGREGLGT